MSASVNLTPASTLLAYLAEHEFHYGPARGTDYAHLDDAADATSAEARGELLGRLSRPRLKSCADLAVALAAAVEDGKMKLAAAKAKVRAAYYNEGR